MEVQDFVLRILKSHIQRNRLAHTYLLTGEKNSGKEEVALAFAQSLNCLEKRYFETCECTSCRKVKAKNHPDVQWLGGEEKVRSIKIESVREILGWASLKPYEGRWKVFIILNADKLTLDAANALLKVLEEPPPQTIFVLSVESRVYLPDTILSRCFEVRFRPAGILSDENGEEERAGITENIQGKNWEDFLDEYTAKSREEIKKILDLLMIHLNRRNAQAENPKLDNLISFTRAMDLLAESKDALDSNVNQKLVLSRLAMQLRKLFTLEAVLK